MEDDMKEDITVYHGKLMKLVIKKDRTVWLYTRELGPSWEGFTIAPNIMAPFFLAYKNGLPYPSKRISFNTERHYQKNGVDYYESGSMSLEADEGFDKFIGFSSVKLSYDDFSMYIYMSTMDFLLETFCEHNLVDSD